MAPEDDILSWKSVEITHVEYVEGDLFGLLLAWMSLLPIFVVVSFVTCIVLRRDLHTMCYFVGQLVNELINFLAKRLIKERRPDSSRDRAPTGYGMPSSHSQFMAFFTTYLILFLFFRLHHSEVTLHNLWKHVVALLSSIASVLVIVSRVYLLYHTVPQVLCGSFAGILTGCCWFLLVHRVLAPCFPLIASWSVSEWLMVRDSSLIPNCLWFEYCAYRSEARTRQRRSL